MCDGVAVSRYELDVCQRVDLARQQLLDNIFVNSAKTLAVRASITTPWPEDFHAELMAEGAAVDRQLALLHAEGAYREVPVLTHINHVEDHGALLDQLHDLVPVLQRVHMVHLNSGLVTNDMVFDEVNTSSLSLWLPNIAQLEHDLPVHVGDVDRVFVQQYYFLDSESCEPHRHARPEPAHTKTQTHRLLNLGLVPVLYTDLPIEDAH